MARQTKVDDAAATPPVETDAPEDTTGSEGEGVNTAPRPTPAETDPQAIETNGLSDAEIIARRSADIHSSAAKNDEHVKVFVLPPGPKPTEANGYDHAANKAATRQYAISQGMRPTGDVRLVSIKKHDNGISWVLTYAVPVAVADAIEEPSEGQIVLDGKSEAPANTDGAGHSEDTSSGKTA